MGMSSSDGPAEVPALCPHCAGQLRMWWIFVTKKPSREGSSLAEHRVVLVVGSTPIAETSHAQNLFQGQGTHSHPLSHRERDWSGKKNVQKGKLVCRMWGLEGLAPSAAAWRAGRASCSTRGGDRSCRYVEGRTSTKGVWSSLLGKARGKPGKAASQGGRRIFLDVILFLVLKLNDKSVSRKA